MFTQPFIQTQIKEKIKAPCQWPLCGEFTGTGEFPAQRASYAKNVSIWWRHHVSDREAWTPFQYPIRRLIVKSRKVSKPRDRDLKTSYRFEILQAHRQHCCRCACQISERWDNFKYKSRGFKALRDLFIRRFMGYWNKAQIEWLSMRNDGVILKQINRY